MRISACHPLHDFRPLAGMPPMPSLSNPAGYQAVRCAHCGLMGFHRKGDYTIVLTGCGPTDRHLAKDCAEHSFAPATMESYAKITSPRLVMQGHHFNHLIIGSTHKIMPPPSDDPGDLEGVWVPGPSGPVKLLGGEFLPVRIRKRNPRVVIL